MRALPVVLVLVATASVGVVAGPDLLRTSDDDVLRALPPAASAASYYRPYERLVDMLPNARHPQGESASDSLVLGRVSGVERTAGYDMRDQAGTAGKPGADVVAFDDERADWRSLTLTVRVLEVLGGSAVRTLEVDWPLMGNSQGRTVSLLSS